MKINSVRAFTKRFYVFIFVGVSFMMISCDENNSCSNIKNGLYYKKSEHIDKIHIDKINKEDFENNYSKQYAELIEKIKVLYEKYGNDGGQEKNEKGQEGNNEDSESDDVEYNPPNEFVTKVREIVGANEKVYEETYKQIDKYTRKIPPMPWAYGCTIKSLVMYILHNPIIKCAVQYFDNYKYTSDETGETFDKMVRNPNKPIDEWHNCLVTFIRLLKLTYEELESDNTDVKVHGRLWNQIQGLEYLLHFLCFGYRRGWFAVTNTINFLQVFLNVLGVFDFSENAEVFGLDKKKLEYSAYCCYFNGFKTSIFGCPEEKVGEDYLDSICCKYKGLFLKNILYIISKSNRANWMIQHIQGQHCFHFYLCKNAWSVVKKIKGEPRETVVEEKVYYIHDGWYEYQDFINKILPQPEKRGYYYYSIPFTYIISPVESAENIRTIKIKDSSLFKNEEMACFWDYLIPLLSTDLGSVGKHSEKLYNNFECSNEEAKKQILISFLDVLCLSISTFVEDYVSYVGLNGEDYDYKLSKDIIEKLLSLVDENLSQEVEENKDIFKIKEDYRVERGKIKKQYKEDEDFKKKSIEALRRTINKLRWFLKENDVVDLIIECYNNIRMEPAKKKAFIKEKSGQIPRVIAEMYEEYAKKHFFSFKEEDGFRSFNLVHGENGASWYYDEKGKYKKADVLKVNWKSTGLNRKDLPIFREKFEEYKFFKSATFDDDV